MSGARVLDGRVAMLTGAARGIGAATARALVDKGAAVMICDVLEDEAQQTVAALEESGGRAAACRVDVADPESVREGVARTVETFGGLHIGFNNAGIFAAAPLVEVGVEDWRRVVDVNLSGIFYCLKFQLAHMLEHGGGAIVNTASVWSEAGAAGQTAYVATKHGVTGLTRNAAIDHGAQGVRVNAVAPGPIATPMTEVVPSEVMDPILARTVENRFGQAEEVAAAAAWLCTDEASFVNGSVLTVDGGWAAG